MQHKLSHQSNIEASEDEFLTADQLAKKLKISRSTIEKHTAKRQVPGQTKIGRIWRYFLPAVEKRLQSGNQFFLSSETYRFTKAPQERLSVAELPSMYRSKA